MTDAQKTNSQVMTPPSVGPPPTFSLATPVRDYLNGSGGRILSMRNSRWFKGTRPPQSGSYFIIVFLIKFATFYLVL